jgi:hypothetical protein
MASSAVKKAAKKLMGFCKCCECGAIMTWQSLTPEIVNQGELCAQIPRLSPCCKSEVMIASNSDVDEYYGHH